MAQLIKLQDYISRYETDLSRYTSQFVRLKKQQWERLNAEWQSGGFLETEDLYDDDAMEDEKSGIFTKIKGLFKKEDDLDNDVADHNPVQEDPFDFLAQMPLDAETEEDLKRVFLDQLLRFQLKWASSTLTEKSFLDSKYYRDERLKYFLQRLPDSFLLLYEPIFLLKKAPVELEVLLLTPTGIWCLSFLEEENDAAFAGSGDHFWVKRMGGNEKKVLNPTLSVNRMEKIVKQLFQLYEVELPIYKAVISRNGYIDYPDSPSELLILDKRSYEDWFQRMRGNSSPLKSMQIRGAKALLEYCQTTSFRRLEWELDMSNADES